MERPPRSGGDVLRDLIRENRDGRQMASLAAMVRGRCGGLGHPDLAAPLLPPDVVLVPVTPTAERCLVLTGPTTRPWSTLVLALIDASERARR